MHHEIGSVVLMRRELRLSQALVLKRDEHGPRAELGVERSRSFDWRL
jgi:hypothetical protein